MTTTAGTSEHKAPLNELDFSGDLWGYRLAMSTLSVVVLLLFEEISSATVSRSRVGVMVAPARLCLVSSSWLPSDLLVDPLRMPLAATQYLRQLLVVTPRSKCGCPVNAACHMDVVRARAHRDVSETFNVTNPNLAVVQGHRPSNDIIATLEQLGGPQPHINPERPRNSSDAQPKQSSPKRVPNNPEALLCSPCRYWFRGFRVGFRV